MSLSLGTRWPTRSRSSVSESYFIIVGPDRNAKTGGVQHHDQVFEVVKPNASGLHRFIDRLLSADPLHRDARAVMPAQSRSPAALRAAVLPVIPSSSPASARRAAAASPRLTRDRPRARHASAPRRASGQQSAPR